MLQNSNTITRQFKKLQADNQSISLLCDKLKERDSSPTF